METTTPFDLNQAIQRWRASLAQSPTFLYENLNELESHLRDSIAALQTKGLSEREAFLIASQRIGNEPQLKDEFAKVNRNEIWLERLLWMLIGYEAWSLVRGIAGFMTQNFLLFVWKAPSLDQGMAFPISVVSAVRSLLIVLGACVCWWWITRKSGGPSEWLGKKLQRRSSFLGCCVATLVLLVAGAILLCSFQALCIWRLGPETFGQRNYYLGHSQVITQFLQEVIMIILILGLARKRLVSAKT